MFRIRVAGLVALSLPVTLVAIACGDDDSAAPGAVDAGHDSSLSDVSSQPIDSGETPDTGGNETDASDAGSSDANATPTQLAKFNAVFGELAEGVAVVPGGPVVTFAPLGKVVQVLSDGGVVDYATFAGAMDSYTLGMVTDGTGALYVAIANTGPSPVPAPGVYKIPAGGGTPTAFAISAGKPMMFLNGIALKGTDFYITDSTGTIFKADSTGATTEWLTDVALAGDVNDCKLMNGFPIGANGIAFDATNLYITNTDKGALYKIPIGGDGKAGPPSVIVKDPQLCGADGLVIDTDGSFLIAVNAKNSIARVTATGTVSIVSQGLPIDGPGSVLIDTSGGTKRLLITNTAFGSSAVDAGGSNSGLLSLPIP